jgi:predicted DNA-binding transcriptional regulator AlpA
MTDTQREYVNEIELEALTGVSASKWRKDRMLGGDAGPPFVKIGRSVRYHLPTVRAWLNERTRRSTSEVTTEAA